MKKVITGLAILAISGCSTMINGTSQSIALMSNDFENIDIKVQAVNQRVSNRLPANLPVYAGNAKAPITVTISQSCYEPTSVTLRKELADSYWLNVFNGIGFFVDYATGAMWQYPEEVVVRVSKIGYCTEETANL